MTRTGKSNSVKKIIQATVDMTKNAPHELDRPVEESAAETLEPFTEDGVPKYPVGQIIFDINGEYANPNMQDEGTAIFEMFSEQTTRFSTIPKPDFKVLKVNFYRDVLSGFELVRTHLGESTGNYIESFRAVDLEEPDDYATNRSASTRHDRRVAAYLCCLYMAGFEPPDGFTVRFSGNGDLNKMVKADGSIDPSSGISLEEATNWFTTIWDNYDSDPYFSDYKKKKGHEWADEDLKAILVMLTRKRTPGGNATIDGYRKLRGISDLHTSSVDKPFEVEIIEELRKGRIIIVDLSQGDPVLPGKADPANPYGRTTYYSNKLILKTSGGQVYVVSLPTREVLANPEEDDFENLPEILTNIEKLRCDMYDNALVPVALANKLVSLANHPSSGILQRFATEAISR